VTKSVGAERAAEEEVLRGCILGTNGGQLTSKQRAGYEGRATDISKTGRGGLREGRRPISWRPTKPCSCVQFPLPTPATRDAANQRGGSRW
jgi:hypothetical protein